MVLVGHCWTCILSAGHNGWVISIHDVVSAVGPAVFELVVPGESRPVDDVFLAEPGAAALGAPGDLVLGIGAGGDLGTLVDRCADAGAVGLVLRESAARHETASRAAQARGLPLVALRDAVAWAHVVWLLRAVIDRAVGPAAPTAGDAGVHNDLFGLADTVAAIADAPVTVEDNRSRVLAYSSGQGATDPARLSTIVGRRVPPELVAHFRALGVFRRLARSNEPFLIPAGPDLGLPRLVVPVRAGEEWLGSLWLVVEEIPAPAVLHELRNAASVLALHLLRLRAQAEVERRGTAEALREVLRRPTADPALALGEPPWRVALLTGQPSGRDVEHDVELWLATFRRHGWVRPHAVDLDGVVVALVAEKGVTESWPSLRRIVEETHRDDPGIRALAGRPASTAAALASSRADAFELLAVQTRLGAATAYEDAWPVLTLHRAVSAVGGALLGGGLEGPVALLHQHDRAHGTRYVSTLRAYLARPGDPRRAAMDLHVHPNTLRNRMRRLTELVDVPLDEPGHRLALQLQLEAALRTE